MKKQHNESSLNPWLILASIIIFVIGAGIFVYPAISNYLAELNQKEIITAYDDSILEANKEKLKEELKQAQIYNENLAGDPLHDPFVPGSGFAIPDNYEEVLNLNGDGVMGYIDIPKIDVYLPIYHGTEEEVLQKGAGHLEGSSLPIGMEGMLSFISAHRGLPSAKLFTDLDKVVVGDTFFIKVLDETLAYEVYKVETIIPEEIMTIASIVEEDIVTLMTCTPYGVNTHRLLVYGKRVPYTSQEIEELEVVEKKPLVSMWVLEYAFAIVLGLIVVLVIILFYRIYKGYKYKRKC